MLLSAGGAALTFALALTGAALTFALALTGAARTGAALTGPSPGPSPPSYACHFLQAKPPLTQPRPEPSERLKAVPPEPSPQP